ncbi:hypothetical protein V2H45_03120 [Tumidithrix elongata RA019]|uniref:Abortive infection protein-like C-terminal domain-containing protein n=1 Tax=Tumidithrix elongata BACA0141 TaxID=2716417 RepID=A0AAW9PP77_9CYAN|nr:hypothetical protein [Tumidithrix elongata RA019]
MTQVSLDISYEQTRTLILENLESSSGGQTTILYGNLAQSVVSKGIAPDPHAGDGTRHMNPQYELPQKYKAWIEDIIWDLIIEGIIRPGRGIGNANENSLPWYHISEYGRSKLGSQPPEPYDPDKYLARVKAISNDHVILAYLEESLKAFRIHCLLSSVITLGCASEKAILLLIDACENSISNPTDKADFKKKTDTISIKRKHDEFQNILRTKINQTLPSDIKENLDNYLTGLFSIIRSHRNDAGHPSGRVIEREHLYALLVTFPAYLEKIYSLIDWLSNNHI